MIIDRYDKTRKCSVHDIRLRNELGKMQYFACGHTSLTKVRAYEAKLKDQIREWKMFPDRKIKQATFSEFVNRHYIPDHVNSLKSKRDYVSICKKLVRAFGDISMEAFEGYQAEAYLKRRYNEVSVYMANREYITLKGIFTKAEAWRYRTKGTNPCKASKGEGVRMRKEEPRCRVLTVPEVDNLLQQCKKGRGRFLAREFNEMNRLTIEELCRALASDGFSPLGLCKPSSIEWANHVLLLPDLYESVTKQKCALPSKRVTDLRRKYFDSMDEADLIRLNRVLLEEFYPNETPKMPKKAMGLTEKEAVELRDQIELMLETGPRKEELLKLRCCDVNFETGMVRYNGKGNKTRFVPINKRARKILERRVRERNGDGKSYIFGDGKIAPKDFKKAFGSACGHAGIENARPHDLRRTFATRCAMAGIPPKVLQKWMGHENIQTTMKYYVQIPEQFEKEAIEKLTDFGKKDSQGDS